MEQRSRGGGPRRAGQIIPKGTDKWLVRVYLGQMDGHLQYHNKTIHGSRKDAQAYLTARLRERDLGVLTGRTHETLDQYLDRWLRDVAPMTRKARTRSTDSMILRLYVRPHLGGYRPADLSAVEALFNLALCTGMRPEEYLGLQRRDVNLPLGLVTVNRVLVNDHGKIYYDDDPKTDNGRRTLLVPEPALTLLKAHMLTSPHKDPEAPVFAYPDGRPLDARNLNCRQFQPLCRQAGLPVIRLYDLRHTHATLMHAAGVEQKVYGAGLGHSSITVTVDTYTHVLPAMKKEAVEKFERFLKAAHAGPEGPRITRRVRCGWETTQGHR